MSPIKYPPPPFRKPDLVWGFDRYEDSASFGELLVDRILLKIEPGVIALDELEEKLCGVLAHADQVDIIEEKEVDGLNYAKVVNDEYSPTQIGWLRTTMLKELGKDEPGVKAG